MLPGVRAWYSYNAVELGMASLKMSRMAAACCWRVQRTNCIAQATPSVDLRHQHIGWHGTSGIVLVMLALGQHDRALCHFRVGKLLQQVMDAVHTRPLLVDGLHHPPALFGYVRALQHQLLGARVILPATPRLQVHGTQLPLLERVM